jgi:hypothetical protein
LPYRVFNFAGEKPDEGSEGWASFWRSAVALQLIKRDHQGLAIEPQVQAFPRGPISWSPEAIFDFRVQSRKAKELWPAAPRKKKSGRQVIYDWPAIKAVVDNYLDVSPDPDSLKTLQAFHEKVCDLLEPVTKVPRETALKNFLRLNYRDKYEHQ